MRHRERGITLVGWLFLLIPLAIVGYAGIRVTPMYLNFMRVNKALGQVATEFPEQTTITPEAVRVALGKHFDIDSIEHPKLSEIDIHRDGEQWVAIADYEDTAPLFANISLVVHFYKEVELR